MPPLRKSGRSVFIFFAVGLIVRGLEHFLRRGITNHDQMRLLPGPDLALLCLVGDHKIETFLRWYSLNETAPQRVFLDLPARILEDGKLTWGNREVVACGDAEGSREQRHAGRTLQLRTRKSSRPDCQKQAVAVPDRFVGGVIIGNY